MIVTRAPLRVSFVGGGTDLPAYFREEPGAVFSATINKYVYVTMGGKFDGKIRLSYSQTENVERLDDLHHDLVRNMFKVLKLDNPINHNGLEIATIADVPGTGTGLGSSSALSVALLLALKNRYKIGIGNKLSLREWLARKACELEIDVCGKPIGKQDQYAASYGGFNLFRFWPDETVEVFGAQGKKNVLDRLQVRFILLYLDKMRSSDKILADQQAVARDHKKTYKRMADLAEEFFAAVSDDNLEPVGALLDENWECKKRLVGGISDPEIDALYEKAKKHGALGGKVLGAGGGGFMLLYAEPEKHANIIEKLGLRVVPFRFVRDGAKLLFKDEK